MSFNWTDTGLPLPSSFALTHLNSIARKVTESGHTLQRSRFTRDFETAGISFQMTADDFRIFKGVWKYYLDNGTGWFFMDLPVGGVDLLTPSKVRFASNYKHQYKTHASVDISINIEFEEVEVIDEGDLALLISGVEPTVPYTTEGVGYIFQQNTGDVTYARITGTSTGAYAAISPLGEENTQTVGTSTFDAITTTGELGFRIDAWSCVSAVDNTPAGLLYEVDLVNPTGTEPSLVNIDLRKAASLKEVILDFANQMSTFRGTSGSSDRTFDLHNRNLLNTVTLRQSPIITTINISHPQTVDTIEPVDVSLSVLNGLTSLNLSGWFDGLQFENSTSLTGLLDLTNVDFDSTSGPVYVDLTNNDGLTAVGLPSGVANNFRFLGSANIREISSVGASTLAAFSIDFSNCNLDDVAVYNIIDAILDPADPSNPHASTTLTHTGNPSSGTLAAPTIALAASKNITLNPAS